MAVEQTVTGDNHANITLSSQAGRKCAEGAGAGGLGAGAEGDAAHSGRWSSWEGDVVMRRSVDVPNAAEANI